MAALRLPLTAQMKSSASGLFRTIEGDFVMIAIRRKMELLTAYAAITTTLLVAHIVAFASGMWWYR